MPILSPISDKPEYLAILLHGYGERGEKMIRRVAAPLSLPFPTILFAAPDAPHACKEFPEGFDWLRFDGEWIADNIWKTALETECWVNSYIDGLLAEYGLSDDRLILAGFSQGGAIAIQTALRRQKPCLAVITFGAPLPMTDRILADVRSRPPICLIHGEEDTIVPSERYHQAYAELVTCGIPVTGHLLPDTGHKINAEALESAVDFLQGRLSA